MSQPSLDLGYEDLPDPTYSVRELADAVNQVLRRGFGDGVWVRGEVEGLQQRANGHVYFSLTERDSDGQATIAVAFFANTAYRLRGLLARHRLTLRNGLNVRIHGTLDFYAPNGRLSLKMDGLDPTFTLGRLAADRDQLLRRLVGEGLLDRNRRLIVPVAPLRVGLVTSRGSAAWHDVITELERSGYAFHLVHVDVRVQGQGAAEQVAAALRTLGRYGVDIICVVRGGGSRSDLATFDSEVVARAIAASPVPVLTGLGHEIDRSVADEVAHTALKTPTACAVHLVERVRDAAQETEARWAAIGRAARAVLTAADTRTEAVTGRIAARTRHAVDVAEARLEADVARARRSTAAVLVRESARVERAAGRVEGAARRQAAVADRELTRLAGRLGPRARRLPDDAARRLDGIDARLRALDPARTLARGWSITRRSDGSIVRSAADLAMGDELTTTFAQGSARSRVEGVDDATAG